MVVRLYWVTVFTPTQIPTFAYVKVFNPSNAEAIFAKAQGRKDFEKPSTCKLFHVGIHWIAHTEYSQMSTHVQAHVPGFQSFVRIIVSFTIGQTSHQHHKG